MKYKNNDVVNIYIMKIILDCFKPDELIMNKKSKKHFIKIVIDNETSFMKYEKFKKLLKIYYKKQEA